MQFNGNLKRNVLGKFGRWLIRAFRVWKYYYKQLFWSYYFYRTKRVALCCDIKCGIKYIGKKSLKLPHPVGVIIGIGVQIGENCSIFQNTTIGSKNMSFEANDYPKIGNNVIIGANSVIIGNIKIGDNVIIGAMTLVNKSIPDNAIVIGNPMKIIGFKE